MFFGHGRAFIPVAFYISARTDFFWLHFPFGFCLFMCFHPKIHASRIGMSMFKALSCVILSLNVTIITFISCFIFYIPFCMVYMIPLSLFFKFFSVSDFSPPRVFVGESLFFVFCFYIIITYIIVVSFLVCLFVNQNEIRRVNGEQKS